MLKHLSIAALALLLIGGIVYAQCINCVPRPTQCCCKSHCKPDPAKTVCASPQTELAADALQAPASLEPALAQHAAVQPVVATNYDLAPAMALESSPPDLVVLHATFLI